jgi:hypothetical protein
MPAAYFVEAIWDPEAEIYYAETDIPGLAIEAPNLVEFEELVRHFAPELLEHNVGPEAVGAPIELRAKRVLQLAAA